MGHDHLRGHPADGNRRAGVRVPRPPVRPLTPRRAEGHARGTGRAPGRLVHTGNVLVDVVATVAGLPPRGGDVLARGMLATVGGGFNLMLAAARRGIGVDYAGPRGTGPFAALTETALAEAGIRPLVATARTVDVGVVLVMVDDTGERTMVSSPAAVTGPFAGELAQARPRGRDAVSVTGYGLLEGESRAAML